MRVIRLAPMILLLCLLLTGCKAGETTSHQTEALEQYGRLEQFSARVSITADYGQSILQYEAQLEGDRTSGTLTVLSPEQIDGTGFVWHDGTGEVYFDGVTLETGELSPDGLSPVDAMPMLLGALTSGRLLDSCEETLAGEGTLRLTMANPNYPEGKSEVTLWLHREDYSLRRAEIAWEGVRVITMEFTQFTYTTQPETQEG